MGLSRFAENHSPNSFFHFCIEGDGYTYLYHGEDGLIHVELTEQSEVMKKLHGFTVFVGNVMPEKTKDEIVDYLGVVVSIAMGNEEIVGGNRYNKENLMDYLLTDMNMLGALIAYIIAYLNIAEIDINALLGKIDTIQEAFKNGSFDKDFYNAWYKLCVKYGLSKEQARKLLRIVKSYYTDIMSNPRTKYGLKELQLSSNIKANYLYETHDYIHNSITNIEDTAYPKVNKWDYYANQDWYDILDVDSIIRGVDSYINAVTEVITVCDNGIDEVFKTQWELDRSYALKIDDTYNTIETYIKKLQEMSDSISI